MRHTCQEKCTEEFILPYKRSPVIFQTTKVFPNPRTEMYNNAAYQSLCRVVAFVFFFFQAFLPGGPASNTLPWKSMDDYTHSSTVSMEEAGFQTCPPFFIFIRITNLRIKIRFFVLFSACRKQ